MDVDKARNKAKNTEEHAEELTFITEIALDYEAPIIASIFEANELPHVIQGQSHRGMMGVLGGGFVPLRLLVPQKHATRARELISEYRAQLSAEQATLDLEEREGEEGEEAYVPGRRLFTDKARRAGISILLGAIIGFGSASLYARLYLIALPIALLQLALLMSENGVSNATILLMQLAELCSVNLSAFTYDLKIGLTSLDLVAALLWILLRRD